MEKEHDKKLPWMEQIRIDLEKKGKGTVTSNIIKCYDCGKDVSKNALICPNCGCTINAMPHQPKCPNCGSVFLKKISLKNKVGAGALFGVFAIGHIAKTFKCRKCGYKW